MIVCVCMYHWRRNKLFLVKPTKNYPSKGHLIWKCLFGVFKFFQNMNENKSTWGIIVVKSIFFVRFFLEELRIPKSPFEINWPLVASFLKSRPHLYSRNFVKISRYSVIFKWGSLYRLTWYIGEFQGMARAFLLRRPYRAL